MMGKKTEKTDPRLFALGRRNLLLIAVAFVVIILGFALMAGAGSTPEHYNPDIFSFRRIVLAPTIAFLGFFSWYLPFCTKILKKYPIPISDDVARRIVAGTYTGSHRVSSRK